MTFQTLASIDLTGCTKPQLKAFVKLARAEWDKAIDLRTANVSDLVEYLTMYLAHKAKEEEAIAKQAATPLSCDVCNGQYCDLPTPKLNVEIVGFPANPTPEDLAMLAEMQKQHNVEIKEVVAPKIKTSHPLLYRKLCTLAAHRLIDSPDAHRLQARSEIVRLNHECNKILTTMPIMRRSQEFGSDSSVPMRYVLEEAENSPEYIANQKAIAAQQQKLNELAAKLPVLLTSQQLEMGRLEVDAYLQGDPSEQNLSNQEKHHLTLIRAGRDDWGYLDDEYTTVAEPLLQSILYDNQLIACITRNSYGVRCLNAYQVMFVDIDLQDDDEVSFSSHPWGDKSTTEQEIMSAIAEVCHDYSLTFEVYRTCKGFRLLEISRLWDVQGYESQAVLSRLGSDKLYQELCLRQECYRARLELKPWRNGDTICHWITQIGQALPIPEAVVIKDIHDGYCLGDGILA